MKKLEFLIIEIADRLIGIDSNEIKKVFSYTGIKNEPEIFNYYKIEKRFFKLDEIFNINSDIEYNSSILVDIDDSKDIMISVPLISTIINIEISNILILPEYIKKKQKPILVWGFTLNEGKIITLITFSYFLN